MLQRILVTAALTLGKPPCSGPCEHAPKASRRLWGVTRRMRAFFASFAFSPWELVRVDLRFDIVTPIPATSAEPAQKELIRLEPRSGDVFPMIRKAFADGKASQSEPRLFSPAPGT